MISIISNTNNIMPKKVLSLTIEKDILNKWKVYTEKECINSSQLIEKLLKEYLNKINGGKKK